ncbi:hypothetical protein BKA82DRAFT_2603790 [Pisolithus tinctorius]|nr:hypothetical protein BKA82DRAFT_2603790 [Pisolithus tinctorius]
MVIFITACISALLLRQCIRIMYGFVQHPTLIHCPYVLQLVQNIKHESSYISIPMLSMSRQPSMLAIAEHGIGCVIVFEYLFFQLQVVKDGGTTQKDLQQDLTVIVSKYQKSGVQKTVIAHIAEAFQQHGDSVDDLCPMLVGIAQANQMSKTFPK